MKLLLFGGTFDPPHKGHILSLIHILAQTCEKCGATLFKKGSRLYCAKEGCGFETQVNKQ